MQVFGNIATPVEKRPAKSGKEYYTFRLAENQGKDDNRTTTWYDVNAFLNELDADLLSKGQFVKVTGRLDVKPFQRKNGELAASATILAFAVEPVQRKEGRPGASSDGSSQSGSTGSGASRTPAPTPAPAGGFDDMDDDIPF